MVSCVVFLSKNLDLLLRRPQASAIYLKTKPAVSISPIDQRNAQMTSTAPQLQPAETFAANNSPRRARWQHEITKGEFELYQPASSIPLNDLSQLPCREQRKAAFKLALRVAPGETAWVDLDPHTRELRRVAAGGPPLAGFRYEQTASSDQLVLFAKHDQVRVNGIRPLPMAVLETKDLIRLGPQSLFYLTERVTPYSGPPTDAMIAAGVRCAFCRLAFDKSTHILTHQCGLAFHDESEETHPEIPESDRLQCASRLAVCLGCKTPLSREPYLVWDPASIETT